MGKRKRKGNQNKKKFWCFYCDRRFQDEKVLIQHQRSKHFKCDFCNKKLTSASGLKTHSWRLHRRHLEKVPNAKSGRDTFSYEIYGMEGIPRHFLQAERVAQGGEPLKKKQKLGNETSLKNLLQKSSSVSSSNPQLMVSQPPPAQVKKKIVIKKKVFLVYDDNEVSMEEKRASLPKYSISRN